jgi:hypothetical protein
VQVPSGNFAERILRVFHYQSGQTWFYFFTGIILMHTTM